MPLAPLDINVANVAKPAGAAKVKPASVPLLSAADEALISAAVARVHLAEALSAPPPPPTLPAIGGALTCTRMLGEGGFGQVWQGTLSRPTTDVVVAVKIVSIGDKDKEGTATSDEIARECATHDLLFRGGAHTTCNGLISLHGHTLEAERAILVLEFFDGIELLEHVAPLDASVSGWLCESEARMYTSQITCALNHMHGVGVAHLDVKPQNVLVHPPSGRLKLIDYGSSATFEPAAARGSTARLVEDHGGTQNYMSPERHLDEDEGGFDGPSADVWSLGCLVFFMLRGYPPYDWEWSLHPPYTSTKLLIRLRAKYDAPKPNPSARNRMRMSHSPQAAAHCFERVG
jgi:serine/threonine protein kinase